jgi:hypothetical protein
MPAKCPSVAVEVRETRRETPESRFHHKVDCVGLLADGWSYAAVAKAYHHGPATFAMVAEGQETGSSWCGVDSASYRPPARLLEPPNQGPDLASPI